MAIVSDGFWRRALGSDPSILGRQLSLSGNLYTVVGVLPPAFRWADVDVLAPLPLPERARGDHQIDVIGRLDHGVTLERARAELAAIASALSRQYPDSNRGWSVRLVPFDEWLVPPAVRESLMLLLGAIGVVLLIACANVASLLLARAGARQREIAIRVALGARRGRIVRQFLTEAVLLAVAAGGIGLVVGAAATRLLVTFGPASVPRLEETSVDLRVLAFGLAVSALTAVIFGLVPALQLSREAPAAALQDAARGSSGVRPQRARSILTVAEIALSVILLIGAGLLLRSVWRLQQVNPGFEAAPSMMARVAFPDAGFEPYTRRAFFERALGEIQALPGIVAAAASSGVPLAGLNLNTEVQTPAASAAGRGPTGAGWVLVTPGYFAAMSIPLRGADFSWRDQASEALTIIISESLAREYWPNRDPIGQPIVLGSFGNRTWTIIGVAGDVRQVGLDSEPRPTVYYSVAGLGVRAPLSIVWRSAVGSRIARRRRACHRATHRSGDGALRRRGNPRSRRRFAGAAPVQYVPAGDLCGRRARPLRDRALRRHRLPRLAANARDWRAACPWRRPGRHLPSGYRTRDEAGCRRRRCRPRRRLLADADHAEPGLLGVDERSHDLRRRSRHPRRGGAPRLLSSRPPGHARRSCRCAALRVALRIVSQRRSKFAGGFQFRIKVIGESASSMTLLIRNRWPSFETRYCCFWAPCTTVPIRV